MARIARLGVLREVVILLMLRCASCRDEPEAPIVFGVNDRQDGALGHADQDEALLAIILTVVQSLDCKRISKTWIAVSKFTPCLA
jgi:hypothetical protein